MIHRTGNSLGNNCEDNGFIEVIPTLKITYEHESVNSLKLLSFYLQTCYLWTWYLLNLQVQLAVPIPRGDA